MLSSGDVSCEANLATGVVFAHEGAGQAALSRNYFELEREGPHMSGVPYLHGDVVTLRTIEREDIDFLHEMSNTRELWRGFGAPGPRNRTAIEDQFEEQNTGTAFLICTDDTPVGRVRLVDVDETWGNAELTCFVAPDFQGQGFATEACQLVIDYGFDYLPITKITVRLFESNTASQHLLEKLGFTHEGTFRNHVFHDGQELDMECYGLLDQEWRERSGE